jgi:flagellar motor protein MotB
MRHLFRKKSEDEHNFWMSYTDLMSGFLIVFIIASLIAYSDYKEQKKEYEEEKARYEESRKQYDDLVAVLADKDLDITDLKDEITRARHVLDSVKKNDLRNLIPEYQDILVSSDEIRVEFDKQRGSIILTHMDNDKYLFESGRAEMEPELQRFIKAHGKKMVEKTISLWKKNNFSNIELRIEGHTDPSWDGTRGSDYGYMRNLELSSARANQVYTYMLNELGLSREQKEFVKKNMISIGYSFSRRVANNDINDISLDPSSRRIEFRIISK